MTYLGRSRPVACRRFGRRSGDIPVPPWGPQVGGLVTYVWDYRQPSSGRDHGDCLSGRGVPGGRFGLF